MLVKITDYTDPLLFQMIQDYEEEFSKITGKKPGPDGLFTLDTDITPPNHTFFWVVDGTPVGFCVKTSYPPYSDIGEFYITPEKRGQKHGLAFAHAVFDFYPGPWQVRQIEGAEAAINFWRRTIDSYTNGEYQESVQDDPTWGKVTCQRFNST